MSLDLNDDLLAAGDPDSIDEALNGMELDDSMLFGGDDDEQQQPAEANAEHITSSEGNESNQPEVIDTTGHGAVDKPTERTVKEIDGKLYLEVDSNNSEVMGRDGKHKIPYEVLERARKGASGTKELEAKIAELEGQLQTTNEKSEMFKNQLTEAGLDPEQLPEELLNDPKAIERIQEEYPGDAGKVIAALIGKVQGGQGNQQPPAQQEPVQAQTGASPVMKALESDQLKELNAWRTGDNDRWEMALVIDNKLDKNPEFSNMSIEERFAEVQRRVKAAFGDPVQASIDKAMGNQQPQQAQQSQQPPMPNSPSALGTGGQDTIQAAHEALASQDAFAMERSMAGMSDSQLESFLEQAGMAFD